MGQWIQSYSNNVTALAHFTQITWQQRMCRSLVMPLQRFLSICRALLTATPRQLSILEKICVLGTTGVEEQLVLLMAVVDHIRTAVESCSSNLAWAQEARQLQKRLQALRTAVLSAEAGAGRSVFFFLLSRHCNGP